MAARSDGEEMEEEEDGDGGEKAEQQQQQQEQQQLRQQVMETKEGEEAKGEEASLLRGFEHIYQEYRELVLEVQSVRSRCNAEASKREALEIGYNSLRQDNERLKKLYMEKLINFADQFECHSKYQSLKGELDEADRKLVNMKAEHEKTVEKLEQEHQMKTAELEKQMACFVLQQSANEATINQLQQELAGHKMKVDALNKHLNHVAADTELQYQHEIQELRDWIMVEQQEKNELLKKLQIAETELLISKTKQAEQLRESISNRHVETLKQKVMKLRKENESLKRQLANADSADL